MKSEEATVISKDEQADITPQKAIELLKEGNKRFREGEQLVRDHSAHIAATAGGQHPFAAILGCIDSRVPHETIFDLGIGDIFSARIAGNLINTDILGSLEFACKVAGSKAIVVLGHSSCGAVKGACDDVKLGNLTDLLSRIKPAIDSVHTEEGAERSSNNEDFVQKVADRNVELSISSIMENSPLLKNMMEKGEIAVIGAMYHVDTGEVTFFE